jgi:acetyltransferase-like isoleucine patch superfamily enzyme
MLGIGSRVIPGIVIGPRCTVGAGAVVVRNVAAGVTVKGVPAK